MGTFLIEGVLVETVGGDLLEHLLYLCSLGSDNYTRRRCKCLFFHY
jgi:hypothetical protein